MPTYEYECTKCNRVFDLFQGIKDKPITKCPTCRGKVRRLIGRGAGIIFKGNGFYQTDYRSEHYQKRAAEDKKRAEPAAAEVKKPEAKKDKSGSVGRSAK